jgi:hypothetical protein
MMTVTNAIGNNESNSVCNHSGNILKIVGSGGKGNVFMSVTYHQLARTPVCATYSLPVIIIFSYVLFGLPRARGL